MKIIYLLGLTLLLGCTQDQQNQLSRKVVEIMDSDYLVTYANGTTPKTWKIDNGKVTSSEKGYYYFGTKRNIMSKCRLSIRLLRKLILKKIMPLF